MSPHFEPDSHTVRKLWESNAPAWTDLARKGYDVYRDLVNTPAFLGMLPAIRGLQGLDVGCGEGHNTRLLAERGADMIGIDIAEPFVRAAGRDRHLVADAQRLPFAGTRFDFATAFMCLMDMPDPDSVLAEICRVLKPAGFFQFSITHPCFNPPLRRVVLDGQGNKEAIAVGRYFDTGPQLEQWSFSAAPEAIRSRYPPFRVAHFHRTLSEWLNGIVKAGFTIEQIAEPHADEQTARQSPKVADTRIVAYFLHIRARKQL